MKHAIGILVKRLSNTHLGDVIIGSSVNTVAKVLATGLGFAGSLLIARYYSADVLGRIATLSSLFSILTLFALLGNQTYILRTIPPQLERFGASLALATFYRVGKLVFFSAAAVSVTALFALQLYPDIFNGVKDYQFLLCGLIFATCLKKISLPALRALGDYKIFSAFEILPALFMMLAVIVSVWMNVQDEAFFYLYYAPHFLLACLSLYFVRRQFNARTVRLKQSSKATNFEAAEKTNQLSSAIPSYKHILQISIPMLGVTLSNAVITNTDILMLSAFTNEETVGVYSIYVKIAALMSITIIAMNSMYAPKAARLFAAGKIPQLKVLTKQSTLLVFALSFIALMAILLIHRPLLALYGEEFTADMGTLYLLLFSMLANAFFGSVGILLNMTGYQKEFFKIMLIAALVNILANFVLIPLYGTAGAAFSTAVTVLFWNTMAVLQVRKHHGFTTFPARGKLPDKKV